MNNPLLTLQKYFAPPVFLNRPTYCATCRGKLPLFVTDELAGDNADALYPEVAFHLDICPTCLDEYESLSHLLNAALFDEEPA